MFMSYLDDFNHSPPVKVETPVNTSNGNGSTVSSGGTKTKIIRVNGGETLNSTIDKVSQLESAYL